MKTTFVLKTAALILIILVVKQMMKTCTMPKVLPEGAFTASTVTNIDIIRTMIKQRIAYIRKRRGLLLPANEQILNKLENLVPDLNFDNISTFLQLLPGNKLGMLPLVPLPRTPPPVMMQFEQARTGWYFGYATFADQNSTVFFQITRDEVLPRSERQKYWAIGNSTVYTLVVGLGINGKYYRTNYWGCPGTFQIHDSDNFTFVSSPMDNRGKYRLIHSKTPKGEFSIQLDFLANLTSVDENKEISAKGTFQMNSEVPMYPNGSNWCQPCVFGDGTLYGSYTNLKTTGSAVITDGDPSKPTTYNMINGIGWMDHQWGGSESNSVLGKLFWNVLSKGETMNTISRYVWMNLHVSDQLQYMVAGFPTSVPKINETILCGFNKYTPQGLSLMNKGAKATVMSTKNYNGTEWPVTYKVELEGKTYVLDSSSYGTQCVIDSTNSDHWVGSSNLLDDSGKRIGTGFIEQIKFFSEEIFFKNLWTKAGSTYPEVTRWNFAQKDSSAYVISAILIIVLFILYIIFVVVFIIECWSLLKNKDQQSLQRQ